MKKLKAFVVLFAVGIIIGTLIWMTACSEESPGPKAFEAYRSGEISVASSFVPSSNANTCDVSVSGTIVKTIDDPFHDDYGDGTYEYPKHSSYYARQGAHFNDVNQVVVSTDSSYIYFYITMADRSSQYYNSSSYLWRAGYDHVLICVWLSDGDSTGGSDLYVNSPLDAGPYSLNASSDMKWDYAMAVIGNAIRTNASDIKRQNTSLPFWATNGGVVFHYSIGYTGKTNDATIKSEPIVEFTTDKVYIITNTAVQVEDEYEIAVVSNMYHTLVYKIPFANLSNMALTNMYMLLTTWDWEDWGLKYYNQNPGVNGHPRGASDFGGAWEYKIPNDPGNAAKIMDLVCSPDVSQEEILSNRPATIPTNAWIKLW